MASRRFFTSESVSMGHPDKMCDQISDAKITEKMSRRPANDRVGSPAVSFEAPDELENMRSLSDYSGHWLLLVFHRHLA